MATKNDTQQFVILPMRGLHADDAVAGARVQAFLETLHGVKAGSRHKVDQGRGAPRDDVTIRVVDSIGPSAAKLVEIATASLPALRAAQPGIRIAPVVYYRTANTERLSARSAPTPAARRAGKSTPTTIAVVSKPDATPVPGAMVVAFSDFANRTGAQGVTNKKGTVALALPGVTTIERIYVYPEHGFWPFLRKNLKTARTTTVKLEPIDLTYTDGLSYFAGRGTPTTGQGVRVGVIDSGIDLHHPDLAVAGGANTVTGEDPRDYGDSGGEHHATHVAGIIAGRGTPPKGIRGVAPAAQLYSYRVFGKDSSGASNFSIAKAIDQATTDGCDLLNLSLGGGSPDAVVHAALEDARARGVLPIIAAGNDGRGPVAFPGREPSAIAISALGRKGTFPAQTTETGDIAAPYGTDRHNFIASFSNIGPEIDLTGPGVGIISTIVGRYAVMDGTSMACPAVTGVAARLLSTSPQLQAGHDADRSDAIAQLLLTSAATLGLKPDYEGQGLPH